MELVHDITYSPQTLGYAEHICRNYSYYESLYNSKLDEIVYSFTSKNGNVKINSYKKADTTAESALNLASKKDKELVKLKSIVNGMTKTVNLLDEEHKNFLNEYLLNTDSKWPGKDLESKRRRKNILTILLLQMGEPPFRKR